MDDPYAALVRYYDAENTDLVDDLPAYARLAKRFGGPVLDVGCGTGRVALYLAQQGYQVTGIDISAAMLSRAREHAIRQQTEITWLQVDVIHLALEEQFGLAIFAFNGFMHLLEQRDQIAALECLRAHLKPGGGLAIDLPNPIEMFRAEDTAALVVERLFNDPETNQPIMQQSLAKLDRASQIMSLTWVYDRIGSQGTIQRDLIPLRLRYTFASEMSLLLERAGLGLDALWGDYDSSPYHEESPRLFVVAKRR